MSVETDPRVAKLPRWAQDRIELLEMRVVEQTKKAEAARAAMERVGDRVANTIADPFDDIPIRLGRNVMVRYQIVDGEAFEYLDVQLREDPRRGTYLEVRSDGGITVSPRATNSVEVRCAADRY